MSETTSHDEQILGPISHDRLVNQLKEALNSLPTHNSAAACCCILVGGDCLSAPEELENMNSFILNLLTFFCDPDHAAAFNTIEGFYTAHQWPAYLKRMHEAFETMKSKTAFAEMLISQAEPSYFITQWAAREIQADYKLAA